MQTTLAYVVPRASVAFDIEWLKIGAFFVGRDQELAELFLSLGFLLFVLNGYRKARDWRRQGEPFNSPGIIGFVDEQAFRPTSATQVRLIVAPVDKVRKDPRLSH